MKDGLSTFPEYKSPGVRWQEIVFQKQQDKTIALAVQVSWIEANDAFR